MKERNLGKPLPVCAEHVPNGSIVMHCAGCDSVLLATCDSLTETWADILKAYRETMGWHLEMEGPKVKSARCDLCVKDAQTDGVS